MCHLSMRYLVDTWFGQHVVSRCAHMCVVAGIVFCAHSLFSARFMLTLTSLLVRACTTDCQALSLFFMLAVRDGLALTLTSILVRACMSGCEAVSFFRTLCAHTCCYVSCMCIIAFVMKCNNALCNFQVMCTFSFFASNVALTLSFIHSHLIF
jgi:hypothetical protein